MPVMTIKPGKHDPVKKPGHYTYGRYECIDIIEDILADASGPEAFLIGNAIKYLWRFQHKNGTEDLEKARWYLDRAITRRRAMAEKPAPCEKGQAGRNEDDRGPWKNEPAAWEDGRPIYNKAAAEAAARHIGEMGEFFDELIRDRKCSIGRLGSINPDSPAPFTGLVCIGKDKYITMPYRFFSPLPKTGADENPQEKPDA